VFFNSGCAKYNDGQPYAVRKEKYRPKQKENNMNLELKGRIFATPSALTMIVDGEEIHSGQVGSGQPLDTEIVLVEMSDVTPDSTLSVTISVTAGVITVGQVLDRVGHDIRTNILINGSLPLWPATPVDPMPGGSPGEPDWSGWFFEIGAGETITFNLAVPGEAPLDP
jgi:hypothetical protein